MPTTRILRTRTRPTHFRPGTRKRTNFCSKLSIGWAGFFVSHREAVTLILDQHGAQPQQSEIETGISVGLSALRDTASGEIGHDLLSVLPDSLWISTDHGSVAYGGFASTAGQTEKSAIGMTRNWNTPARLISAIGNRLCKRRHKLPDDVQWRGHGMDATGNLYSGRWSLSGNLSWYKANDFALSNNSNENSVNGSLFVNWQPALGPKLSAGVTNYAYAADFLDYNGVQKNSLMRYQLAVDGSQLLVTALSDRNTHLTFLASYQGNKSRSQWSQADYSNDMGNVFVGFRFTRPLRPVIALLRDQRQSPCPRTIPHCALS